MPVSTTPAFEIQNPIGFADPVVHYRRNLAGALSTAEITHRIEFSDPITHYRRNLASASPGMLLVSRTAMADARTQLPRVRGVYPPAILIDMVIAPSLSGDNTLEIVYNIPGKLRIRPHLIAPPNGSQNRLGSPVLIWTETSEAAYYEVHVARDIDFTQRVFRLNVLGGQAQAGVPFGGTYYWRVRAVAGAKYSDYSEVWSFTVPGLLPVEVGTHDPDGRGRLLTQFKENE